MSASEPKDPIYIPHAGPALLATPLLNKGTAFSEQERHDFNLTGLIPNRFETIEEQAERAYLQYKTFKTPINQHIYLRYLQDNNETLFYYLLKAHLVEMMPIIYTPTVGEACERFSEIYRRARGVFISYPDKDRIDEILHNVTKDKIKVIVVTDGSRILGLGDQGVGGMGIPIGKLSLYTACAGISPAYTLPIMLDIGTNNQTLLNNPLYIGWKHKRINDTEYDEFIELFIKAMKKRWPDVLLQFEDFEQSKALPILERYQNELCCFNDDIQGTAAVTVGTLLAACQVKNQTLSQQKIVFAGAGSAGCGIAEQIIRQMMAEGLDETQARERVFMIDKAGLLVDDMAGLFDFQRKLSQKSRIREQWGVDNSILALEDVIQFAQPTVLIGVSGQAGLFNERLIKNLLSHCERPIIFPLSNPSKQIEAIPESLIRWTDGSAIIATGSPFEPVHYQDKTYPVAQCNNSYIFPGIGLAVIAGQIKHITPEMMMVASEVLASASPFVNGKGSDLLPALDNIAELSKKMASQIVKLAQQQELAPFISDQELEQKIEKVFWSPDYREYKRVSV